MESLWAYLEDENSSGVELTLSFEKGKITDG